MVALVEAYQAEAVRDFERILRSHRPAIMGDPFIAQYMADLLANVRTQVGGCVHVGGVGGGWVGHVAWRARRGAHAAAAPRCTAS